MKHYFVSYQYNVVGNGGFGFGFGNMVWEAQDVFDYRACQIYLSKECKGKSFIILFWQEISDATFEATEKTRLSHGA